MYHAEIPANITVPQVRTLEFLILFLCEIGHGPLEFGDDGAWRKRASGKYAQL